jgi:DNA-binding MarR family transcriptional regulator
MSKEARFAALVSDVAREVMRRRSSDACCGDLTLEQFETLQAVAKSDQAKEPSTIGSLSTALGVDISTMSRNVSVLERNGYLARRRSTDDGRIVQVRLTLKGKKALTDLRCGERDVLANVYDAIPAAEREKVLEALESLRAGLVGSEAAAACCAPVSIRRRTS